MRRFVAVLVAVNCLAGVTARLLVSGDIARPRGRTPPASTVSPALAPRQAAPLRRGPPRVRREASTRSVPDGLAAGNPGDSRAPETLRAVGAGRPPRADVSPSAFPSERVVDAGVHLAGAPAGAPVVEGRVDSRGPFLVEVMDARAGPAAQPLKVHFSERSGSFSLRLNPGEYSVRARDPAGLVTSWTEVRVMPGARAWIELGEFLPGPPGD